MRKLKLALVAIALMLVPMGAIAQQSVSQLVLAPDTAVEVSCQDGQIPSATGESPILVICPQEVQERTPTPTSEPTESSTRTPTPTPTPTPTDTPIASIDPYLGAPECADSLHSLTDKAHSIWNSDEGCHFDHAHMMPGISASDSPLYALYQQYMTTQEISYPWETPDENKNKHEGYFLLIWPEHIQKGCVQTVQLEDTIGVGDDCIVDFYHQFHGSTAFGMGTRFHSFAGCFALDQDSSVIGDEGESCFGGHVDYPKVSLPYGSDDPPNDGDIVHLNPLDPVLPDYGGGTHYFPGNIPPYLAARPPAFCTNSRKSMESDLAQGALDHDWNSGSNFTGSEDDPYIFASRVEVDFQGRDAWGGNCASDPTVVVFPAEVGMPDACPHCDNSENRIYEIVVHIPDLNGDGSRVQFTGFTNLLGNIDLTCTEAGPTCAPAYIDAMPGRYTYRIPVIERYTDNVEQALEILKYDMDIWFSGQPSGWFEFPGLP